LEYGVQTAIGVIAPYSDSA